MEYLDDVAQETEQGVTLVQSKSALTANPVSDRAKSLWKTLSNWVTLAASGGCDPKRTLFEIYVSRPVTGTLVEAFTAATTVEAAQAAILLARSKLWGAGPDFENRAEVSADIASYLDNVFEGDQDQVAAIIKNFQLTCGSGSPQADIEAILKTHPISHSKIRDIAIHMCGVVKNRVDEMLEAGMPAIISRDDFHTQYGAYVRKIDRETVLSSRAKQPGQDEMQGHMPRLFVQQLDLIGMSYEEKLAAVSDYLMAIADRTDWTASGEVDASSFEDLNAVLERHWKNKRLSCRAAHASKPPENQGQLLYAECMQVTVQLQAMQPSPHFIPGCFHELADDLSVGWHPDYSMHLKAKKAA